MVGDARRQQPSSPPSVDFLFLQTFGAMLVLMPAPVPGRIPGFAGEGNRLDTEPQAPAAGVAHEDEHHSGGLAGGSGAVAAHPAQELAKNNNIAAGYVSTAASSTPTR